jgi:hypothetical protein
VLSVKRVQRDAISGDVGLTFVAIAAAGVGSNRKMGDILGTVDPAEPSDDVKIGDILHLDRSNRVRRNVPTDIERPRAARKRSRRRRLHSWTPYGSLVGGSGPSGLERVLAKAAINGTLSIQCRIAYTYSFTTDAISTIVRIYGKYREKQIAVH